MDLFSFAGVAVRRWYVTLSVVAIGLVIGLQAYSSIEPVYTATEELVILRGPEDIVDGVQNLFARTYDARLPAQILEKSLDSREFVESLGLPPELGTEISATANIAFPTITVRVTSATPEGAVSAMETVNARAATVLNEFQAVAGAPETTRFVLFEAVPVGEASESRADGLRYAGAVLAIALAFAVPVAAAWDYVARRRGATKPQAADARREAGGVDEE